MNEKAAELGLESTEYVDPAGLFDANVSSAYDMARLISFASGNERMAAIMRTPQYSIDAGRRRITVSSTNQLVKSGDVDVQAGKTGFIRERRLLPGHAAAAAAGRRRSGGGRPGRQVERGPLLGNPAPVQLALGQGRRSAGQPARSRGSRSRSRAVEFTHPDSRVGSLPRRAAAWPRCRRSETPAATRGARRTPSGNAGTGRSRTPGIGRRRVANDDTRARSWLRQNGHAVPSKPHCRWQWPHTRRRDGGRDDDGEIGFRAAQRAVAVRPRTRAPAAAETPRRTGRGTAASPAPAPGPACRPRRLRLGGGAPVWRSAVLAYQAAAAASRPGLRPSASARA